MRSSISNSNAVGPAGPWLKTWLLTIALAVAAGAGWETALRQMGHRPSVVDDEALWARQRDRVYTRGGKKSIVLLGDCRVQLGLVPEVLRASLQEHRVVQLAVQETSPIATLRDLAADQKFDGIVVCGVDAQMLCREMWETQQRYVDYYHAEYRLNARLNRSFATLAQRTLASIHPQLRLSDLLVRLVKGEPLPSPHYLETRADRSRRADYTRVDLDMHRKWVYDRARWLATNGDLPGTDQWLRDAMEVEQWVDEIQSRGGRVVFVQLPTTGRLRSYEELLFPKKTFWDAFAARTSATCIHFKDVPQLAGFDCPDTIHLDRTDAPRFTRELGKVLAERNVFEAPARILAAGRTAEATAGNSY